jgi:hypothetical protein
MPELAKVNSIVKKAASAILTRQAGPRRVFSEPIADSDGQDALYVTIVLRPGGTDKITGDMVVDTAVEIQRALRAAGEDRFPIIEYATEEELAASDETES